MTLTRESLSSIGKANRRLAIIGKFRCGDPTPRYVFSNDTSNQNVRKLNAQNFFATIQPELRFQLSNTHQIQIGDVSFRGFQILTPASTSDEQQAKRMPILLGSRLLEDLKPTHSEEGLDLYEKIQKIGGELFKQLVGNLDTLSKFTHGNYVKGLSRILEVYLPVEANNELRLHAERQGRAEISVVDLQKAFATHLSLRSELIKYLVCLEDDESIVRGSIRRQFASWAEEGGELQLTQSKSMLCLHLYSVSRRVCMMTALRFEAISSRIGSIGSTT